MFLQAPADLLLIVCCCFFEFVDRQLGKKFCMLLFVILSFCFPGKICSEWKDDVVGTDVLCSFAEKKTEGATRGVL